MAFRLTSIFAVLLLPLMSVPAAADRNVPVARSEATAGSAIQPGNRRTKTIETGPMKIDRIYHSMTGPYELVDVDMTDVDWVTAIRTEVLDDGSGASMGGEYFCHSQLQLASGIRLTVNATGTEEIRLPPGFAIPVGEILDGIPVESRSVRFLGMVLNNHFPTIDRLARIRATIEYFRDADLGDSPPPRKLYTYHVPMQVQDLAAYETLPGEPQPHEDVTTHCALVDGQLTHWFVPPGPQTTRRLIEGLVPIESTIHLISTHVHNHGEYVRLTDLTDGKVLWQADVEYDRERRQIRNIPVYASSEGLRVYPDHQYEIEAFYNNTSDADVDAMAVLYLYFNPKDDRRLFPGRTEAP